MVVPTRDRVAMLARALASVSAQSSPPAELIVVDDGSTDGTAEFVARQHPEARLLRSLQSGVSAARNRGILEATYEWIAFLDSDDEWLPHKLATQMAALRAHPEMLLCHADEIWIRNGARVNPRRRHRKSGGWIFARCLPLCAMSPSSVLLHRRLLDEVGAFDEELPACEDYDLWLRITCRYPVLFVDEPLVRKHGGHADQLSRRFWGMDRFRVRALEKLLRTDVLSDEQRRAAIETLRGKIEIVRNGAAKRGRETEAAAYTARLAALDREVERGIAG